MTQDVMTIDVTELKRVQKEIEDKIEEMHGTEMLMMLRQATLMVQRDAKIFAPVDTGRLRASITPSVTSSRDTIQGVVGSAVTYAPFQEFGTKHMEGKRYLGRAFDANIHRIEQMFNITVNRIIET